MYMHIYIYIYVYVYENYITARIRILRRTCTYICMYVYMYINLYIHTYMYIIYTYVHIYTYMYIIYIYTRMHTHVYMYIHRCPPTWKFWRIHRPLLIVHRALLQYTPLTWVFFLPFLSVWRSLLNKHSVLFGVKETLFQRNLLCLWECIAFYIPCKSSSQNSIWDMVKCLDPGFG